MAYARVTLTDGSIIEVGIETEHPDALDQMIGRLKDLWSEAVEPEAET